MMTATIQTRFNNPELECSFRLPDVYTAGTDARYWQAFNEGKEIAEREGIPFMGAIQWGCVLGAALQSGLIEDWKCASLPELPQAKSLEGVGGAILPLAYWAGPIIDAYIAEQLRVPKVSFWGRVRRVFTALRPRPN